MAAGPTNIGLGEADLHGAVDGCLSAERRALVLRKLAASPPDRARVQAWQRQSELISKAFRNVEAEPLPIGLDLKSTARLHNVHGAETPTVTGFKPNSGGARHRLAGVAVAGVAAVLAVGGVAWFETWGRGAVGSIADAPLRGSADEIVANGAATALAADTGGLAPDSATSPSLPTTTIPDLTPAGFVFVKAETQASEPPSLNFHYRNAAAERVVVSVARAPQATEVVAPAQVGSTFSWRRGENAYAIAGTVRPERLRAIAVSLQGDETEE